MARADKLHWIQHSPDMLTGWHGLDWPARRYLVVEAIPGGGWDWVAWASTPAASTMSGAAQTREAAMHEAMRAMDRLCGGDAA